MLLLGGVFDLYQPLTLLARDDTTRQSRLVLIMYVYRSYNHRFSAITPAWERRCSPSQCGLFPLLRPADKFLKKERT